VCPLPCGRPIERVLQRNGLTAPRVRLAPLLTCQEYPDPQARASNQSIRVGKRHRGPYLRLAMDTTHGWLTAFLNG
jgi:hypothetical protein